MQNDTIFFHAPAQNWLQCMPIGNGHIGAMLGGDPLRETIYLNDDTLWSGYPRDYTKVDFEENIRLARERLLQNKRAEAEEIVEARLANRFTQAYLPLGNLTICMQAGQVEGYSRSLDLSCGVHTTSYLHNGARVTFESFVSFPVDAMLYQIECERPRDVHISFQSQIRTQVYYDASGFTVKGTAPSDLVIGDVGNFYSEKNKLVYDEPDRATHFSVRLQLISDGTISFDPSGLSISGAKKLTLAHCSATNFSKGEAYTQYAQQRAAEAVRQGFETAKAEHMRDHAALYQRASIRFGNGKDETSCEDRLLRMRKGEATGDDFALLYQYGRYLLIASSRKESQASNLQGIWNRDLIPPWWCGYTLNINLQMNYWLADRTNLSDCFEPFAAFTKRLAEAGKHTARADYGVEGSVAHHQSDLWAHTTPVGFDRERIELSARWMMWNMALPWLSLQLYDHYRFTREERFLSETLYPVMKASADFMRNTFTQTEDGLCNVPSTSPENMYVDADGSPRAVCVMSAMDIALSKEFSLAFAQVCEERDLAEDAAFWRAFSRNVRDYSRMADGTLREWDADFSQTEAGHRHFSMLFGIYPGESLLGSALQPGARSALKQRLMSGSGQTGWSAVWAALLLARFGEGDEAYALLEKLMRENIHDNLFGAHPPELFQIDANFGFTIALCELLIQEAHGVVSILPALPKALQKGSVEGLLIHGGHSMSFGWRNGVLCWLTIEPARDDMLTLRGEDLSHIGLHPSEAGLCSLPVQKGEVLRFSCESEVPKN